jgi:hypothetical protein
MLVTPHNPQSIEAEGREEKLTKGLATTSRR